MQYSILIPTAGACMSFGAALDLHVGTGAVDLLMELCFSDATPGPADVLLPMKHSSGTMSFLSAGFAFASIACLAAWRANEMARHGDTESLLELDFNLAAALSMLANVSERYGPQDICEAYRRARARSMDLETAQTVYDLFSLETIEDDLNLFVGISDPLERARIICAAMTFSRYADDPEELFEVVDGIANALEMDIAEIAKAQSMLSVEGPNSTRSITFAPELSFFDRLSTLIGTRAFKSVASKWVSRLRLPPKGSREFSR